MPESNSLVIFTKAALLLAEADTIQKAKEPAGEIFRERLNPIERSILDNLSRLLSR
jgi:hypothetical protein